MSESVPSTGRSISSQQLVPASLVLALAAVVAWLSFTREPADAFLFPRLISCAMLLLALWNFLRAALGYSRVGQGLSMSTVKALTPGLLIMLLYGLWLAKNLGFYVASTAAFFVLYSIYDPSPHSRLWSWGRRVLVTAGFMTVIYLLFDVLLKVQTPRGMFL